MYVRHTPMRHINTYAAAHAHMRCISAAYLVSIFPDLFSHSSEKNIALKQHPYKVEVSIFTKQHIQYCPPRCFYRFMLLNLRRKHTQSINQMKFVCDSLSLYEKFDACCGSVLTAMNIYYLESLLICVPLVHFYNKKTHSQN